MMNHFIDVSINNVYTELWIINSFLEGNSSHRHPCIKLYILSGIIPYLIMYILLLFNLKEPQSWYFEIWHKTYLLKKKLSTHKSVCVSFNIKVLEFIIYVKLCFFFFRISHSCVWFRFYCGKKMDKWNVG